MGRVAVLYNEPAEGAGPAETDVLVQVDAVCAALSPAWDVVRVGVSLDLAVLDVALDRLRPDVVFNLVEALGGSDRLATLVPLLLDARRITYTGVGSAAQLAVADKVTAKAWLREAGLPTPNWYLAESEPAGVFPGSGCYIVKACHEHASLGMDDGAVVCASGAEDLAVEIARRSDCFGTPFFAERFVAGREFNLALLQDGADVLVLPAAEIDFSAFERGKPRIVGWDAKWSPASFEYQCTPRRFDFPAQDVPLLERLRSLAKQAWSLFGLRGYARVDFRVDPCGDPWILEVNFNPCLSPDAGFAAALDVAGISFREGIARIVAAAATDGSPR
jgi:D-alanine-D-alanine ligase